MSASSYRDMTSSPRAELQRKIVARMRSLGMTPVFPAFAGLVPDALIAHHPQVRRGHTFPSVHAPLKTH